MTPPPDPPPFPFDATAARLRAALRPDSGNLAACLLAQAEVLERLFTDSVIAGFGDGREDAATIALGVRAQGQFLNIVKALEELREALNALGCRTPENYTANELKDTENVSSVKL